MESRFLILMKIASPRQKFPDVVNSIFRAETKMIIKFIITWKLFLSTEIIFYTM